MILKIDFKKLILSLLPPILAGGLAALITRGDMKIYDEIVKPPLAPPAIVFPIVWTALYILMGISFYLVWNSHADAEQKKRAFIFYFAGLILNFAWSPVFFSLKQFLFAFIILVVMYACVAAYTTRFYRMHRTAGLLQIPYLVWLLVAAYLNIGIVLLN